MSKRMPLRAVALVTLVSCWTSAVLASDVVKIEEHWSLTVGGPEPDRCAPQVSMVMSPSDSLDADYFVVTINHHSVPQFAVGGAEVQHWRGSDWMASKQKHTCDSLHHDGETVTWVQRLSINHDTNELIMRVVNGQSESWGNFTSDGALRIAVPTELERLNDYRPAISLTESGISFAGNRVSSLTLTKLVWWTDDGQQFEKQAPIDIDTDLDP